MENVIIQTAFLGDLVLAIPLMRQMTALFPEEPLIVVCRKGLGSIIREAKAADRVIEVDKKNASAWSEQKKEILSLKVNHLVCPHESPRTALLVRQMKVAGNKVGFDKWWNKPVFNIRVRKPMHLPDALRQLSLLTGLSSAFAEEFSDIAGRDEIFNSTITSGLVDFRHNYIPVWAELSEKRGIQPNAPAAQSRVVYLAPGSVWATKRWSLSGYIEVAQALTEEGWQVEVVGAPDEKPLGELIQKSVPSVVNHAGEWTVPQTIENFRHGRALIANDSGAIHLAALTSLPTIAVFGPTTLALGFRPWQRQAVVVQKDLKCRPCGKHGHQECPIKTHACMQTLPAKEILKAAHLFLGAATTAK